MIDFFTVINFWAFPSERAMEKGSTKLTLRNTKGAGNIMFDAFL